MDSSSASVTPPGWYPDPSGQRQWRVWTGEQWSQLTKPYGDPVPTTDVGASFALIRALQRTTRFGVPGFYLGLALIVGISAHWPGTAHPAAAWFAATTIDAGIVLIAIGLAYVTFAVYELTGRWSVEALVPGVNVLALSAFATHRLAGPARRRVASEGVLLLLFILDFRYQPWLGIAPAVLAIGLMQSTATLSDQLMAPASATATTAP